MLFLVATILLLFIVLEKIIVVVHFNKKNF